MNPEILPLPTSSKISYLSVAKDAGHALLIAENDEVYFVGTAHRGEDGEPSMLNSTFMFITCRRVMGDANCKLLMFEQKYETSVDLIVKLNEFLVLNAFYYLSYRKKNLC